MSPRFLYLTVSLFAFEIPGAPFLNAADPLPGKLFQEKLDSFHSGQPGNGETLKIIYFHPNDQPPQANYVERTRRILADFSEFLQEGMTGHGFTVPPVPFERDEEGEITIHVVEGASPGDDYDYGSGAKVKLDVQKRLKDKIDFETDFLFILCGLCQKRGENDFFFHSPYYGDGSSNQIRGLCYAADCEALDPLNLSKAASKVEFRYEEHTGTFNKSLARFNSWYLGGIAHELGHGLSLPHNGQLPSEKREFGNALMGGGNHTYGEERWGGGKGTFLAFANALRLAAHPLFSQSDRERFAKTSADFNNLHYESDGQRLTITGLVTSSPPPLGMIAYADPPGRDGYNAITWVAPVDSDGKFTLELDEHPFTGVHELRLNLVQLNGAVAKMKTTYIVDENHHPDAETLNARFTVLPAARAILNGNEAEAKAYIEEQLSKPQSQTVKQLFAHIHSLSNPAGPVSPVGFEGDRLFLSDAIWKKAEVGWGKPARNKYYHDKRIRNHLLLETGGEFHTKGLYAHAPSEYVFSLNGEWKRFDTVVGLQAGVSWIGRSQFTVFGDGKQLAQSAILKGIQSESLTADLSGINELRLVVESTIEGNPQCWSVWGSPKISR